MNPSALPLATKPFAQVENDRPEDVVGRGYPIRRSVGGAHVEARLVEQGEVEVVPGAPIALYSAGWQWDDISPE